MVNDFFWRCVKAGACVAAIGVASGAAQGVKVKRPVEYANPLVGTAPLDQKKLIGNAPPPGEQLYSGFTSPGATLPHSLFEMSPVNANLSIEFPAGVPWPYYYPNPTVSAFSAGGPGGPWISAVTGDWTAAPAVQEGAYDKSAEKASPGYYSVVLKNFGIKAEMTATMWTGLLRLTFPASDNAHVLVNFDRVLGSVEVVNDHTVRGVVDVGRGRRKDGAPADAYFVAEFSRPFTASGVFHQLPNDAGKQPLVGNYDVTAGGTKVAGNFAGVYLDFHTTAGEQVLVRVGHGQSFEQAEERLRKEEPGWDFEGVKRKAEAAWAERLDRIEVEGGSEKEKMLFYSCLLHSFASPHLLAEKGGTVADFAGKQTVVGHDFYGEVPFWDTGRNQIVLLTLLEPQVKENILASTLDAAKVSGHMATSFHGDNAVFMYLGDWKRGLTFDWASAYDLLRKNAMDPKGPRHFLEEYEKQGWIADVIPNGNPSPPYAGGKAGAATTLEYAWDDAAMAEFAKRLGKEDDARMFAERAQNYRNVFDASVGFMRGKTADGKWISPFDPREPYYNFMMKEASGWSTLWLVPQDVAGLVNLLGGREKAAAKLDEFFATPYAPKGICRDCTGLIGQYVQGNQPDQQAAYYYDWVGQPWKTQKLARQILREMYGSDKTGYAYPGMDDQGSTSSWYVLSAMGFYTVDPSSENYILGSPLFRRVRLKMGNGKVFEIVARNNSATNVYIQSATFNGKSWDKPWFSHSDIANGGTLVLTMGPTPNKSWGAKVEDAPPSISKME